MLLIFPPNLPQPVAIQVTPKERRLSSTVAEGMPQVRTIENNYIAYETLQWRFNAVQAAIFEAWWRDTLLQGGRWFTSYWQHMNQTPMICRFTSAPEWKLVGHEYFEVSVSTEMEGIYNQTNFDRDVGGPVREFDMYMWFASRSLAEESANTRTERYPGRVISNAVGFWGPLNEQPTQFVVWLFYPATGTFPSGATVAWTCVSTPVTNGAPFDVRYPTDLYGRNTTSTSRTDLACQVLVSNAPTRYFTLDLALQASRFFRVPYSHVITATVNGAAIPVKVQFTTQPNYTSTSAFFGSDATSNPQFFPDFPIFSEMIFNGQVVYT